MKPVKNDMETANLGKLIFRFAVPGAVAMLVNALYNIVDQIFIGHGVGYLGNGAANIVLLITMCTLALSLLTGDGAAAYYSLRLGEGKRNEAAQGVGTAFILMGIMSVLVFAVCLLFLQPILRLCGSTDTLLPYATEYGRIIVLGLPFIMLSTSMNAVIRADGSPRYAMLSMIAGAVLNGCLDPIFIFLFDWGIQGAAWATFFGQLLSFIISICYFRNMKQITICRKIFHFRLPLARRICALGISSFIDQTAFTLVMAVNYHLMAYYGPASAYGADIPMTAYGIAMKVQEILFTVLLGIALGMQPIVGYCCGAKKYERVGKAYALTVCIGTVISICATLVFMLLPRQLTLLFGAQGEALYLEFSQMFFRTYFLMYAFFGFQTITGVFFQAIGRPRQAALLSLCYQLVFKIGAAFILCAAIGLPGVLWSGPAADCLAFFLAMVLLTKEFRRLNAEKQKSA